jgi:hypothetical protein
MCYLSNHKFVYSKASVQSRECMAQNTKNKWWIVAKKQGDNAHASVSPCAARALVSMRVRILVYKTIDYYRSVTTYQFPT